MTKRTRKKKKHLLDIIVLAYDVFPLLEQCINSIPEACEGISYRVILFDNGSTDKRAKQAYYKSIESRKDVSVYYTDKNLGFPEGNNRAVKKGSAPLVLLLNSDVVLLPGSITELVGSMDDEKVGIAGMKLLFPEDSVDDARPAGKVQHIGMTTDIGGNVYHVMIGWSADHPKVNATKDVYFVTGAALLIRRSLWDVAKGFPPEFGKGTWEDIHLCMVVRDLGYNIVVNPKAVGYHHVGSAAIAHKEPFPIQQNRQIFLQRWGSKLVYDEWRRM